MWLFGVCMTKAAGGLSLGDPFSNAHVEAHLLTQKGFRQGLPFSSPSQVFASGTPVVSQHGALFAGFKGNLFLATA